ncbi:YiiX/YebB-like N1pC/P60 family cysteine hydrolase [Aquisalimonas sp.]|uniref:YiiX/YebB-like N1pC/P60 family cysteine hydrolase n=1 Tax=Aquisalimonas sp. TaxID=1872621 RepID=UPI0025C24F5C|nr:YiiX/YebB-like N1pC/P60 family cysteine hydrolase [Aquisalimonas sp.]
MMGWGFGIRDKIGKALARHLARDRPGSAQGPTSDIGWLGDTLRPGDVLLVEGTSRFSAAIKYLTQSTWSHAAICIRGRPHVILLEADVLEGVRCVSLDAYAGFHTRVCRPLGLRPDEIEQLIRSLQARVGHQYDLKHIIDLARYLLPTPPVPVRWRRHLLTLGSGDPTRAICSSLIAEAFQAIRYPILPIVREGDASSTNRSAAQPQHRLQRRHATLFTPRDFDISPYFEVVKPALARGFDPHALTWVDSPICAR